MCGQIWQLKNPFINVFFILPSFRVPREATSFTVEILNCDSVGCPLTLSVGPGLARSGGEAGPTQGGGAELVEVGEERRNISCMPNGPACAIDVS